MNKEKQEKRNSFLICCIIVLILVAIIFVPIIIESMTSLNEQKHKNKLINEGKTKTDSEVITEIIEILKNRDETKLKEYLVGDFSYWNDNNFESKFTSEFWSDLTYLVGENYEIEKRGDIHQDETATYWIYWNVVEQNKAKGLNKTDTNYCLQRIQIYLKKVVKQDLITYEIEKIILREK